VWGRTAPPAKRIHLDLFQREHEEIFAAIRDRAVVAARGAMQRHLLNSRQRYQKLMAELEKE
jgi:DNA-binding FadR family transcriptional regulator